LDLAPLAIATVQALFRLSLKVLKLAPLFFDLSLLRLDLLLSLLIGDLLILHFVTNRVTTHAANRAADRRPGSRCSDRSTDDRASNGSDAEATKGPFFTCRERLPQASGDREERHQRQCSHYDTVALHR
jgi:hypothetical protein